VGQKELTVQHSRVGVEDVALKSATHKHTHTHGGVGVAGEGGARSEKLEETNCLPMLRVKLQARVVGAEGGGGCSAAVGGGGGGGGVVDSGLDPQARVLLDSLQRFGRTNLTPSKLSLGRRDVSRFEQEKEEEEEIEL
jgi:hypothetical protein